jgi:membrane associated rhomboid family serine protease
MTKIVKYLFISNIIIFLLTNSNQELWINIFGLHNLDSETYYNFQWVTHLFTHGDISHVVFNMLALLMFGL